MKQNQFEVRVSRWLLLLLIFIGSLFAATGLDILVFKKVFAPAGAGNNPILLTLFGVFAVLIGSVIALSQTYYLIVPPVMLRVSPEGLWLATGLRYKPFLIPLQYLRSINTYQSESMLEIGGKKRIVDGGVELSFEQSQRIPASLVTSAGLSYSNYSLRLFKAYMNQPLQKTVEAVKGFIR